MKESIGFPKYEYKRHFQILVSEVTRSK